MLYTHIFKNNISKHIHSSFKRNYLLNFLDEKDPLPQYPEKTLFTSLITQNMASDEITQFEQEFNIKVGDNEPTNLKPFQKINNFNLKKIEYESIMKKNPAGRVNIFDYKNTRFTLVGTQYEFIPPKNLYKILLYTKPSIIVLQARPDQILKKFNINPTNQEKKFSNRKYFSQLLRKGNIFVV